MLNQLTISELSGRLAKRQCSAREIAQSCLDQIQRVDNSSDLSEKGGVLPRPAAEPQ